MTSDKMRLSLGISMGVFAAVVFYSHQVGGIFPALPVGMVVAVGVLLVSVLHRPVVNRQTAFVALAGFTLLSMLYKIYLFSYPASLVGFDTGLYAHQTQLLLDANHVQGLEAAEIGFYARAPLFILLNALIALLGGTSPEAAMVVYPIIIGVIYPVSAFILAQHIAVREPLRTAAISAAVAAVATLSLQYGFHPLAQTLAVALWLALLLALVRYYDRRTRADFLLVAVFLTSLLLTHKIPGIVVGGTLLTLLGVTTLTEKREVSQTLGSSAPILPLLIFTWITVFVQITFITGFIRRVVLRGVVAISPTFFSTFVERVFALFGGSDPAGGATAPDAVINPLLVFSMNNLYTITLFPLAAVGWVALFIHQRTDPYTRVVLAGSGFLMLFVVLGYVRRVVANPRRFTFFAEVILIVLAAAVVGWLFVIIGRSFSLAKVPVIFGIVLFLFMAQVFAMPALPNHPVGPRDYLTETELQGKRFTQSHVPDRVHTDFFYAAKPPANPSQVGEPRKYLSMDEELLQRSNNLTRHDYVLYRKNVGVYNTPGKLWRLNWNAVRLFNRTYSRIYSNDGTTVFIHSVNQSSK